MRYVITRYEEYQKEMAYRIFVTDALYKSPDNMVIYPNCRYANLLYEENPSKTETRSGDEIAEDVISKAGLVVKV